MLKNRWQIKRTQYFNKNTSPFFGFQVTARMWGLPPLWCFQCFCGCFGEVLKSLVLGCSLFRFQVPWLGALALQTLQGSAYLF